MTDLEVFFMSIDIDPDEITFTEDITHTFKWGAKDMTVTFRKGQTFRVKDMGSVPVGVVTRGISREACEALKKKYGTKKKRKNSPAPADKT